MPENDGGASGNAGGSGTVEYPGWMASLPDAHKTNERFAAFKEAPAVWDKFDSLLQAEGKAVTIPDDKATDEERAAFFGKLGRPEAADKYSITKPADLPEGLAYSPEVETAFKQFAHKTNLTDAQAKATYEWYFGLLKNGHAQQQQAEQQATEAAINALKDEWKGDAFTAKTERAGRVFKKFGGDSEEVAKFINETKVNGVPLGNHPMFLRVFAAIGDVISDDSLADGGRGGGVGDQSEEAKAKARFPNTKW